MARFVKRRFGKRRNFRRSKSRRIKFIKLPRGGYRL